MMHLASEWNVEMQGRVYVDPSAALGMVSWKGDCQMRHRRFGLLWIQEKAENEERNFKKVAGVQNVVTY